MRVAILLASYNRKQKTIDCLKKVYEQEMSNQIDIEVFLTDDASSDGTASEVKRLFPDVNVYHGTGSLFWAGGMRNSWKKALEKEFDFFLISNDDTYLFNDSIDNLIKSNLEFYDQTSIYAISIGSTKDERTGLISYGGRKLFSKYNPKNYLVQCSVQNIECDFGEANIMLVPKVIVQKIGILSDTYTHKTADNDFTLTAKKAGFKIIVAPNYLGTCTNDNGKPWKSSDVNFKERLQYLYNNKGLNYKEYIYYIRKHFPYHLPSAIIKLWLKTLFPIVYDKFKKEQS